MRIDLQTHPKVVRILSATQSDKFRAIGGLHAVWGVFDLHSEDGKLHGYTPETLDHIIGWAGFASAMLGVGWLAFDGQETLTLPEFTEHNGQSAKRRGEDQKRKRDGRKGVRNVSAECADKKRTREEKRREEVKQEQKRPPAAAFDFRADLFARWKSVPGSGGGAFLSRLFKDHKPEQRVIEAVEHTLSETRADPKAFVVGVLKAKPAASNPIEAGIAEADRIRAGWKANPETAPWAGCTWDDQP